MGLTKSGIRRYHSGSPCPHVPAWHQGCHATLHWIDTPFRVSFHAVCGCCYRRHCDASWRGHQRTSGSNHCMYAFRACTDALSIHAVVLCEIMGNGLRGCSARSSSTPFPSSTSYRYTDAPDQSFRLGQVSISVPVSLSPRVIQVNPCTRMVDDMS